MSDRKRSAALMNYASNKKKLCIDQQDLWTRTGFDPDKSPSEGWNYWPGASNWKFQQDKAEYSLWKEAFAFPKVKRNEAIRHQFWLEKLRENRMKDPSTTSIVSQCGGTIVDGSNNCICGISHVLHRVTRMFTTTKEGVNETRFFRQGSTMEEISLLEPFLTTQGFGYAYDPAVDRFKYYSSQRQNHATQEDDSIDDSMVQSDDVSIDSS